MSFSEQMQRSPAALHRQGAGELLLIPAADGTGEESNERRVRNAVIGDEIEREEMHENAPTGMRKIRTREVSLITDRDAEGFIGVELIEKTMQVEIEGVVYSITSILTSDAGRSVLTLERQGLRDAHRGGYRK